MRKTFQRFFLVFLFGAVGFATAGTVKSITDLKPGADGTYTLVSGYVYLISAAGETGVTKEYTLTALGSSINVALRVELGAGKNTIVLRLKSYTPQTAALKDDNGNYVPALKVSGNGTLIVRHEDTSIEAFLRIQDCFQGDLPAIDLSSMLGGEVRFERAAGEAGTKELAIGRVWKDSSSQSADLSAGTNPTPVIKGNSKGNSKVRITFAGGMRVRLQASPCAVRDKSGSSSYVLPELISDGYASMRIEEGAVVRVRRYGASTEAVNAGHPWKAKPLFPDVITLAGGNLELDKAFTGTALIDIPSTNVNAAIALVRGQGEAFGKKIFTVSTKSDVVPERCIKVPDGSMLTEEELKVKNGCLIIEATKSPELVYAQTSESDQNAVTVFGLIPEITETGCTIKCNFGIADLKVDKVDSTGFVSTLKVSVDLPNETVSTRAFYLRVLQTSPNGTETAIYPTSGTAALTTFTRDAAGSSRFSASIPCRITPSRGTPSITVRAYSTPPTK